MTDYIKCPDAEKNTHEKNTMTETSDEVGIYKRMVDVRINILNNVVVCLLTIVAVYYCTLLFDTIIEGCQLRNSELRVALENLQQQQQQGRLNVDFKIPF